MPRIDGVEATRRIRALPKPVSLEALRRILRWDTFSGTPSAEMPYSRPFGAVVAICVPARRSGKHE